MLPASSLLDTPAASLNDPDWAAAARQALQQADARLYRRFDQGDNIERLLALRARAADHLIRLAWQRCLPVESGLSLFAVGGYGRGELFPRSDIDLLVFGGPPAQLAHEAALARLFALLWDCGLAVSHAVRSASQCREAATDQTVLTALIEARPILADDAARRALREAIDDRELWPARAFFLAKLEELRNRHQRFGDTADNLEPDLKDGPGGLRDLNTLGWMALRAFGVRDLKPWSGSAIWVPTKPRRSSANVRCWRGCASACTGSTSPGRAPAFRLPEDPGRAPGLRRRRREPRCRENDAGLLPRRAGGAADQRPPAAALRGTVRWRSAAGTADRGLLPAPRLPGRQRGRLAAWRYRPVFALFSSWANNPQVRGLHSLTARALAEALPLLPAYDQADTDAREQFMTLLRGHRPVDTLSRMARLGVLGQWIPAFAQVSGRMQFDLFHVYTVDQHTLMVLRNIGLFASSRADERFSIAHEVWPRLRKPELLLLAGLFHDIAKGRGGDHSELGAVDARAFCQAHALSTSDTELVAWLVEQHLRMSVTAQKQDIADPVVIHRFATLVGSRDRLDYLYLLTCADIAGTSPKLWNAWKDRLLADLYFATRRALREGLEHPVPAAERVAEARDSVRALVREQGYDDATIDRQFAVMPDEGFIRLRPEQLAWQAAALVPVKQGQTLVKVRRISVDDPALEVFVHSPDRDGLFAAIVMTLDRKGYGIHRARVLDGPADTIFDTFEVNPADSFADGSSANLEAALREALSGDLSRLRPSRRVVPRQLRHFRFAPRIEFRDEPGATRFALVAPPPRPAGRRGVRAAQPGPARA